MNLQQNSSYFSIEERITMNPELKILNLEIDKARTILYKLTNNKSLTDSNVVFCSQKLDKLLNKYHELLS
jgi:hypothetical protein